MNELREIELKYHDRIIDIKDFKFVKRIGSGGNSSVSLYKHKEEDKMYAVKKLIHQRDDFYFYERAKREIEVLMQCRHPNIIKFVGFSLKDANDDDNILIFMEYEKCGSLRDLLDKLHNKNKSPPDDFNNTKKIIILIGIIRGMMYLQHNQIIHRDLKPANIVLDENYHPKIIDFGYSKPYENEESIQISIQCGTDKYMAPEVSGDNTTFKSEVYSFGIIMYELLAEKDPYPKGKTWKKGRLPSFEKLNVPIKKEHRKLIEKCLSENPEMRPSFEELFRNFAYDRDSFEEEEEYDEEDQNITKYKYYFDDVDSDEILSYAFEIDKNYFEINIDTLNQLSDKQIQPLKKDSSKLKLKYSTLKKQIRENQNRYDQIDDKYSVLEKENQEMKKQFQEILKIVKSIKKENDTLKENNEELKNQIHEIQDKNDPQLNNKFDTLEKDITQLKSENSLLTKENKKMKEQIQEMESKVKGIVDSLRNEIPIIRRNNENLLNSIQNINEKNNYLELKQELEEVKKNISIIQNEQDNSSSNLLTDETKQTIDKLIKAGISKAPNKKKPMKTNQKNRKKKAQNFKNDSTNDEDTEIPHLVPPPQICTIQTFNEKTIKEQQLMIDNDDNPYFDRIKQFLNYLIEHVDSDNFVEIATNNSNDSIYKINENYQIHLLNPLIRVLYEKDLLDSLVLKNILLYFKNILIDVNYPSNSFDKLLTIIENLKEDSQGKIKIRIINSGQNNKTDFKFKENQFIDYVKIDSNVTVIDGNKDAGSFYKCSKLIEVDIPPSVVTIGMNAFSFCSLIKNIKMPDSVTKIEKNCFFKCESLETITLSSKIQCIPESAFSGCSKLTSIKIPESVTSIEFQAFRNCSSLRIVVFPSSLINIQKYAFCLCNSLEEVVIPPKVQKIEFGVFSNCSLLNKVKISQSVTLIEESAFSNCTSLEIVDFSDCHRLNKIKKGAFYGCSKLKNVMIPTSVQTIEDKAFPEDTIQTRCK